jgi:autotransporter-associated beta strand protein
MKPRFNSLLHISAVLACTASVHAADFSWDGGTGVWTANNWNSGTSAGPAPWSGHTAIINSGQVSTTAGDQTGGTNLNIGGGTLDSGGNYMRVEANTTLQGGSIIIGRNTYNSGWLGGALGGTITVSGSAASSITGGSYSGLDINMGTLTTFDVGNVTTGTDLTVSVALTDYFDGNWQSSSLVKNGAGTLALTANNNYAGTTTVGGGVLDLSSGIIYRYAGWANRSITVNNGGTVKVSNWGDGNADTAGGFGQIDFAAGNILLNNGTLEYVGGAASGNMDRSFTIGSGGATLVANGSATWQITDAGRGYGIASNGGTLTLSGPSNGLISKAIDGVGGLTKSGAGTWTLSGANNYSGATIVKGGTLKINASTTIGSSNSITVGDAGSSGAVLDATTA